MLSIISNPFAGNGKAIKMTKKTTALLKEKKVEFLVYFSEKQGDITSFISKLYNKGEREFVIIGGDGTINEVINAIPDFTDVKFSIVPAGQNNNFARTLNIKHDLKTLADVILSEDFIKVDYLKCNDRIAINCISLGFSAELIKNFKHRRKTKLNYFLAALKLKKRFGFVDLSIKTSEYETQNQPYKIIAVCNGEYFGSHIRINPFANLLDGRANVMLQEYDSQHKLNKDIISLFAGGKHIYRQNFKQLWTSKIEIAPSENMLQLVIDGEQWEQEKLKIEVVPQAINIKILTNH